MFTSWFQVPLSKERNSGTIENIRFSGGSNGTGTTSDLGFHSGTNFGTTEPTPVEPLVQAEVPLLSTRWNQTGDNL